MMWSGNEICVGPDVWGGFSVRFSLSRGYIFYGIEEGAAKCPWVSGRTRCPPGRKVAVSLV